MQPVYNSLLAILNIPFPLKLPSSTQTPSVRPFPRTESEQKVSLTYDGPHLLSWPGQDKGQGHLVLSTPPGRN